MRLTVSEQRVLVEAARECFGPEARVLLFGSRTDDLRRGGDIDLLIELPESLSAEEAARIRARFVAQVWRRLGERKLDVVLAEPGEEDEFVQTVRSQALPLEKA
ncbi:DNA polymerase beta domain protein region [Nitrosococcus halophilus Nc 4]|uniref:DNA polymerase beta domain protein region n=1 Tax=Nitrosococcus halophilus (strain Nc4) TaxID=472759 RepID=D5BWT2_NITHN|nr:nucleotidyltransferase domain-containing protein [Nitrosococcus halophilus]ADE13813.1 DNA polymerase beta domain protein region [Nitrosococcus halophilus Nc 4]